MRSLVTEVKEIVTLYEVYINLDSLLWKCQLNLLLAADCKIV